MNMLKLMIQLITAITVIYGLMMIMGFHGSTLLGAHDFGNRLEYPG